MSSPLLPDHTGFSPVARATYDIVERLWQEVAQTDWPWVDMSQIDRARDADPLCNQFSRWDQDGVWEELQRAGLIVDDCVDLPGLPGIGLFVHAPSEVPPPWRLQGGD